MNRNQNQRNRNLERPIPGCLGRMVNLFDLNANVGANKLLTDKPHFEGSPVSRSQSDLNNQVIMSEIRKSPSNRKSNGTPIKMLIAQEMSKEDTPKQSPPNLVAKLMGLETLPHQHQQLTSTSSRSNLKTARSLDFNQYKDVFEAWQQTSKTYNKEIKNDKNMALVREKFMEAKRLSTDEKLRQSKQFQDALEVLSSNKDLFLKFLQEPNSLFSQTHNLQSLPPTSETRRITVLKPSKMVNGHTLTGLNKNGKQLNENNSRFLQPTQPTRIVVLKPSSEKLQETKVIKDDQFRKDETLISSVFSNGYIGDESSFSKSEIYYAAGNLSDSEVMSPISRHSWDYINRFGSPYSEVMSSSFSRASYSPESSVCKEAKKRLSERWALMALSGNNNNNAQEQRHVRRSSSTLGEMLAISDLNFKKSGDDSEEKKGSESCLINEMDNKSLGRSKSVPVCSTSENLEFSKVKGEDSKELTKEKSVKSLLFKGKVSSLFFSKSRKSSKLKSEKFDDENRNIGNDGSECVNNIVIEDVPGLHLPEGGFSVTKPETSGNSNENQDQPSPISVLELQFEDDDTNTSSFSRNAKLTEHGPDSIKFNLLDKSPLIGSISRTLSWDDSAVGPATPIQGKMTISPLSPEGEEQEYYKYVQTLLSAAGIDQVNSVSFSARWHSPESPLDPSLREKYITQTNNHNLHQSKQSQRYQKSTQNLVFDCVNEALMDDTTGPNNVWGRVKEWFSGEDRCVSGDDDGGDVAVETVVRKEVVGKIWVEDLKLEIDNIKREIEEKLVEEIVEEFVAQLFVCY